MNIFLIKLINRTTVMIMILIIYINPRSVGPLNIHIENFVIYVHAYDPMPDN